MFGSFTRVSKWMAGLEDALDQDMDDAFDDISKAFDGAPGPIDGDTERVEETITKPDGTVIRRVTTRRVVRK